jgi:murein DD-endopeptidase MepM/ murein hydrolase activator NlpD
MVSQRDTKDRKKFITFMILPHNSMRNVLRINIPYWLATLLSLLAALVLISIVSFFIYSTSITTKILHYKSLQAENKIQSTQIKTFFEKTKELEEGINELEERDQELREMLGLKKVKKTSNNDLKTNYVAETFDVMQKRLAVLKQRIEDRKLQYAMLEDVAQDKVYRFNNFPSIWPVSGVVFQPFGMRRHPFTGRQEFHKGVDIPAWVGCPIRVAADGVIVYSDWSRGYGQTVIVDHGNGYLTLYAHCERLLAQPGDYVTKGQLIAKVGSTGLSTGPHVHYEVQYQNKPINAERFLDLNIRTASNFIR